MKVKVTKSTGKWYQVKTDKNEFLDCRIKGKFRLKGLKLTNPIAVGDQVELTQIKEDWMITKLYPRTNYVVRQSPRKKHFLHLISANIDQAILIVTLVSPNLKQGFIDRFLLMTEPHDIPVTIVYNKSDLYTQDDFDYLEYLMAIYENIGYNNLVVSSLEKSGLKELKAVLKGKLTLVSGQSGVGKSTLINALQPDLELETLEISNYTGKGQHTTTFSQMYEMSFGASIIDTPGIKNLSFNNLTIQEVAHNFREFFIISDKCKYNNCFHRNEPFCAVKEAVEAGKVSELRYKNYLQLIQEVEDQNSWEMHKGV